MLNALKFVEKTLAKKVPTFVGTGPGH